MAPLPSPGPSRRLVQHEVDVVGFDLHPCRGLLRFGPGGPFGVGSQRDELRLGAFSSLLDVGGPADVGTHHASLALVEQAAIELACRHLPRARRAAAESDLAIDRDKCGEFRLAVHHMMNSESELTAFIPVDRQVALGRSPAGTWKMPARQLYRRLLDKCQGRVMRSDIGWAANVKQGTKGTEAEFIALGTDAEWAAWTKSQQAATRVQIEANHIDFMLE